MPNRYGTCANPLHLKIEQEILGLFDFLKTVYGHFGFTFKMKLSTRPEKFLGDVATWDRAEAKLSSALDAFSAEGAAKWELNPGDGAFYGPKIDITISDALKRDFQCATIQLDFQLPQQFNLEYVTSEIKIKAEDEGAEKKSQTGSKVADGLSLETEGPKKDEPAQNLTVDGEKKPETAAPVQKNYRKPLTPGCARPVMIHRAIYGSFERFIAILTEHFAGKWPFWLSPRQILVVPVMPSANDYVLEVQNIFREKGMHVDVDISGNTMKKKILNGQMQQYNYIFVVGAEEKESRTVNIRDRDDQATQVRGEIIKLDDAISKMEQLRDSRVLSKVPAI